MWYKLTELGEVKEISSEEHMSLGGTTQQISYNQIDHDTAVSTAFLGIHIGGDKPMLFETMIFNKNDKAIHQKEFRSETLLEALYAHEKLVAAVKRRLNK